MLRVFVFDERESRAAEDVRAALDELAEGALLWVALRDPTREVALPLDAVMVLGPGRGARAATDASTYAMPRPRCPHRLRRVACPSLLGRA